MNPANLASHQLAGLVAIGASAVVFLACAAMAWANLRRRSHFSLRQMGEVGRSADPFDFYRRTFTPVAGSFAVLAACIYWTFERWS